jgi:hypothetical protein
MKPTPRPLARLVLFLLVLAAPVTATLAFEHAARGSAPEMRRDPTQASPAATQVRVRPEGSESLKATK